MNKKLFMVKYSDFPSVKNFPETLFFNPSIEYLTENKTPLYESCISVPHKMYTSNLNFFFFLFPLIFENFVEERL